MVMPLRPSKFYGSSLPRPFIYNEIKFNSERVDPPMGVTTPFISWAKDALWSMGGFAHKRKHALGSIEGNLKKLRNEEEEESRKKKSEEESHEMQEKEKTPKMKAKAPLFPEENSPVSPHDFAEENTESPMVIPETVPRSKKKISPSVRKRVRKLSEVFNRQAAAGSISKGLSGVATGQEFEPPKVHSLARSASKRQATKGMEAYEYVEQPNKFMKMAAQKKNNTEKEGQGIESGTRRRSRRFSPVT